MMQEDNSYLIRGPHLCNPLWNDLWNSIFTRNSYSRETVQCCIIEILLRYSRSYKITPL